jgi:eukaryotic-like serine/threonine-protein kinase
MKRCPSSAELGRWLADGLAGADAEGVEAHVETCVTCQQALERLTDDIAVRKGRGPVLHGESGGDFLLRLEREPPTVAWPGPGQNERGEGVREPTPPDPGARAAQRTVAVVRDPQSAAEIQTLLRKRLRFFTLWNGAAFAVYLALSFVTLWNRGTFAPYSGSVETIPVQPDLVLMQCAVIALNGGLAWLLFTHWPLSLRCLRWIEGLVFASTALMFTRMHWLLFTWGPLLQSVSRIANEDWFHLVILARGMGSTWFILITAYGLLIPNTWRRCAAVVGVMAVWPVLLNATFALRDRPFETRFTFVAESGIYMAVAVALAVFGAHRIETLRRQAAHAGKLGPYQLKRRLGAGGMGEVYLAEHALLRRPCAVKLVRPERAGDPANLARFEREVQATATLTHPNTVEIFDYGRADDGTFYYAMEYLLGLSLQELVRRYGPLPPERAVHLLRQVCGALQEAHAAALIHRDVKPANVLVCQRGGQHDVAKLLDFGLVRAHGLAGDGEKLTQEGDIAGTPAYMSPEQAAGKADVDARSDLYSLGAVAYFLLTKQSRHP